MGRPAPVWPDWEVEKLRQLRADGMSVRDIPAALGRSTYAVASKIRELGLPAVNDGLRQRGSAKQDRYMRAGKSTLPPLPSLAQD